MNSKDTIKKRLYKGIVVSGIGLTLLTAGTTIIYYTLKEDQRITQSSYIIPDNNALFKTISIVFSFCPCFR